jgi:hypothetical protein
MWRTTMIETKDVISLTLSSAALGVSIFTFALQYRHARRAAVVARKPVLIFVYDGKRGWVLRNVGSGPALNVIVAQKPVDASWFDPVRTPPLAKEAEYVPPWIGHTNINGLGATYADTEGRAYSSECRNDLSEIFDGNTLGRWREDQISRHWNRS